MDLAVLLDRVEQRVARKLGSVEDAQAYEARALARTAGPELAPEGVVSQRRRQKVASERARQFVCRHSEGLYGL